MTPVPLPNTSVVGAAGLKAQKMGSVATVGSGPLGLGPTPTPLAATYISCAARRPCAAVVTTTWGSSATGMRPTRVQSSAGLVSRFGRRMTAISSAPDSATNSRAPRGPIARATGMVPNPALRPTEMVRSTRQRRRSTTTTSSEAERATYARAPARSTTIP